MKPILDGFALLLGAAGAMAASATLPASAGSTAAQARTSFPLRVGEDGRSLVDARRRPFVVVGDSAWSLIAQLNPEGVSRYLADRQKRGFNSIIVNLIEHKFASRAPANIAGVEPFLSPGDFTRPNPRYFDYAYQVVAAANRRRLSVWLCPAYLGWGGGDEGFFREIKAAGPAALRTYGRFVGRRFKDLPNIVWLLGGDDALPEWQRWMANELAAGLREGRASQLMTAHGGQTSALETFGDQPWLAIDTVYRYQADLWRPLLAAYQRRPVRPFVLIETTYEGEHDSKPEQIRRQAWWALLCGAGGQFFGNNPIWHFDGPTLFPFSKDWEAALDSTGSRDIARMARFFSGLGWPRLLPGADAKLISAGAGEGTARITAAQTSDRRLTVLYIPAQDQGPRRFTLDLSALPRPVEARWFNPAQDAASLPLHASFPGWGQPVILTPGNNGTGANDWALVLEAPVARRGLDTTRSR